MAGIIGGQKLVTLAGISKARSLTASSSAGTTEDLTLWFESTSKQSFSSVSPANGSDVSAWYDINPQLTNKKNLTITAEGVPVYNTNLINGLPGVVFSGDDCLVSERSLASSEISSTGQITVFLVGKASSSSSILLRYSDDYNSPYDRMGYIEINASNKIRFDSISNNIVSSSNANNYFIMSGTQNDATQYLYINGALEASSANVPSPTPFTSNLNLGCRFEGGGYFATGEVGEVIIFSRALSDLERKEIEQYLSKKWSIKLVG
jgi:hypothetical protein